MFRCVFIITVNSFNILEYTRKKSIMENMSLKNFYFIVLKHAFAFYGYHLCSSIYVCIIVEQ